MRDKWFLLALLAVAIAAVVYLGEQTRSLDKQLGEAAAANKALTTSKDSEVRKAYSEGLTRCSTEDEATFHDLALTMQTKMDKTTNPYKYLMFKFMYQYVNEWAQNWAYSSEDMEKMVDEYMMGDVEFQ